MSKAHLALLLSVCLTFGGCAGSSPSALSDTEDGLRQAARERLSQLEGSIELPGLEQEVEVLRDRWGVPHIYAKTSRDLFLAQGFVAAQDRLYQMEIWRRTGAGELAEVFGPEYVDRDRIARLVRYRGDMQKEWESYSPDTRQIAEAFAAGVNAYVRHSKDRLPIEFDLLGFTPGEWKAEDILLRIAGLLMTRNAALEVARAEMVSRIGVPQTMRFFPTDPRRQLDPDPELDLAGIDADVLAGYRAAITIPALQEQGSNNWVVDATLSATGKPILASDPHRPVVLPSLRYMAHLVGPGWNIIGSGEPALPGIAIGHNERVGFGFTIVQYDQVDVFVEKTDPANPNRYQFQGQWLEMRVEKEQVRVNGQSPVEVELKFTRHGPVIWEDAKTNRAVSLRWAGDEPGTAGYLGSLALGRVENWDQFVEAMARWKLPSENMVYADVDGNIGWIPAGLLPVRNWSGLLPVPGHTGKYEWSGFRTVDQLPRVKNPAQGYVATANHNIRPRNYPHDLGFDWANPYRFRRIDEVLSKKGKFSVEDFQRLQHDETSLPARELIALLKQAPRGGAPEPDAARAMLEVWDCVLSRDSGAAALYEIWQPLVQRRLVEAEAPEDARELVSRNLQLPTMIDLLARSPKRNEILLEALSAAEKEARALLGEDPAAWRWGKLHTIVFRHPLANTAARQAVFSRGPVERGGDGSTPNATSGANFRQTNGASYRHILDLSDWDRSVFTSTPGQSGQPESPHYDDLLAYWADYRYAPLVYSRKAVEENTAHRLVLKAGR